MATQSNPEENMAVDFSQAANLNELMKTGDALAAAAARVCAEYDGIHRLRAALSNWFDLRANIHGTRGNDLVKKSRKPGDGVANPPSDPKRKADT